MLDQSTKRKIDAARDILVGKIPDPKQQVDQITTALIYKFMDDMDKESEELGGDARFFSNGFDKYSWTKLMDKRLSGQERLDLYVEAITKMSNNPHSPQLFRDIFKDAFLPYRDTETLALFLKEIDGFNYDHSENLGNAFEYLLSVLGSQGNAGQFRTPRHIIDFIVEVVDPKKDETILDPACGTAGFLISSYKHIVKHNSANFQQEKEKTEDKIKEGETAAETVLQEKEAYRGDLLTPEEKAKVMQNIAGYDISPDMVKLSLVNLYLHGFTSPKVFEYDTLTSEKRWDETSDVIMANPPFMTPKGGIRPHKRFSVQANRSEVLFVDYILEHLNRNGRAGVIVPEGIIFKPDTAYKKLRQALIEDGLFAVVSLPAGVFNPYSGVKTSILFFDNQLAKTTNEMLFVKILNDGFDLGAQRRKIDKNDLPKALQVLESWKTGRKQESAIAHWASKEKIVSSADFNLTGDRYKETEIRTNQKWPIIELQEVAETFVDGNWVESKDQANKGIRLIQTGNIGLGEYLDKADKARFISEDTFEKLKCTEVFPGDLLISRLPDPVGRACILPCFSSRAITAVDCTIVRVDKTRLLPEFLLCITKSSRYYGELSQYLTGSSRRRISRTNLGKVRIPLPPLEIQKEIVEQTKVKQQAIDHAKEVIRNLDRERRYFGQSVRKSESVKMTKLSDVCEINRKTAEPTKLFGKTDFIYIDISSVENGTGIINYENKILSYEAPSRARRLVQNHDILLSTVRPNLRAFAYLENLPNRVLASTGFAVLTAKENVLPKYLFYILFADDLLNQMIGRMGKGSYPSINQHDVEQLSIPLPPLEIQKQFVADADEEEETTTANRRLIELMDKKINEIIENVYL